MGMATLEKKTFSWEIAYSFRGLVHGGEHGTGHGGYAGRHGVGGAQTSRSRPAGTRKSESDTGSGLSIRNPKATPSK